MKQTPLLVLLTAFFMSPFSAQALATTCRNDGDCQKGSAVAHCETQKAPCPGHEAVSTCATLTCVPGLRSTKFPEFVKKCDRDADCEIIHLKCECMYCARADDLKAGVADALNKQYVADLAKDFQCTAEQTKNCAMAGACAVSGTTIPVCREHSCTLAYKAKL
jgi:hypothetical protein